MKEPPAAVQEQLIRDMEERIFERTFVIYHDHDIWHLNFTKIKITLDETTWTHEDQLEDETTE